MIRKLLQSILSDNSLLAVSTRFAEEISKLKPEDSFLTDLLNLNSENTEQLKDSIAKSKKNQYTDELKEKDELRDDDFISLRIQIEANLTMRDVDKKKAAAELLEIIRNINYRMHDQGYFDQTADHEKLFSIFDKTENQILLKLLSVDGLYEQLKESQKDFEDAYNKKAEEDEVKKEIPRKKDARISLIECIEGLISYMNLREKMSPETYKDVNIILDKILMDIQSAEKGRITREEEEQEN